MLVVVVVVVKKKVFKRERSTLPSFSSPIIIIIIIIIISQSVSHSLPPHQHHHHLGWIPFFHIFHSNPKKNEEKGAFFPLDKKGFFFLIPCVEYSNSYFYHLAFSFTFLSGLMILSLFSSELIYVHFIMRF